MPKPVALIVATALAVGLSGCVSAETDPAADGVVRIVASTNVYGDVAQTIGGSDVEVTSVIDDPAQDPHEFEANPRVQLDLSRADIVIVNGGGYDDFMQTMLDAADNDDAIVIDAVSISGLDASAEGFNEHVWYDYDAMSRVVAQLAIALQQVDGQNREQYAAAASDVTAELDSLASSAAAARDLVAGAGVVVTEPVPLFLLEAMGFENITPPAFTEAIEEDSDVPPALLQSVLNLIGDGSAAIVVYNEQTGGPQTDAVIDVATDNQVPAIGVTETLPDGTHYVEWQQSLQNAILAALDG